MSLDQYDQLFEAAGTEWNVDPKLLKAVAGQESGGDPRAQSKAGAQGLMQIIPETQRYLGMTDPHDPMQSIYAGAKYLSEALDRERTPEDALRYYHGGPEWRSRFGPESRAYAPAVTARYVALGQAQPARGAAARTGGTDYAGPGAPPPAATAAAPQTDEQWLDEQAKTYPGLAAPKDAAPAQTAAAPAAAPADSKPANPFAASLDAAKAETAKPSASTAPGGTSTAPGGTSTAAANPFAASLDAVKAETAPPPEPDALPPPPPPTLGARIGNVVGDVASKVGAGVGRGLHDLIDPAAELLVRGGNAIGLTNALGAPTPEAMAAANAQGRADYERDYGDNALATGGRVVGQIAGTLPILAGGGAVLGVGARLAAAGAGRVVPAVGRAIEAGTELASGTLRGATPAANVAARGASLATHGALQGAAAGALLSGQSDESAGSQALTGAAAGALLGPAAGAVGAGARALAGRSGGVDTDIAQLAKLARDKYGINIPAPQMSENSLIQAVNDQSAKLPLSGAGKKIAATQTAWQRAVIGQMGETADRVSPAVMSRAATRIGQVFDDVANRTNVTVDNTMLGALGRVETEAAAAPLGAGGQSAIRSQIDNLMEAAAKGNGSLTGDVYQQLTRADSPLDRAIHAADPNVRFYASRIRDALDGAFERSAAAGDKAALQQARSQWRAMKTIEDLAEKSPDGNLSPALLMGQVRGASSRFDSSTGGMAYTGGGPLGDLARIGQQFLKPPANSTTADRQMINALLTGHVITSGLASVTANPYLVGAVPAGLAANRLAGGYLRGAGLANRLIDSSINPNLAPSAMAPIVAPAAAIGYNALAAKR
jgi:Transglycosylase SLT domain